MKLQRNLTSKEWAEVAALGPGIRKYQGKVTVFYNGEENLWEEERESWEVIIVLPGVKVIHWNIFHCCPNVETVIMSDSVKRIDSEAFMECESLKFVKLSRNLKYIGRFAFLFCNSLTSIFIPPSCREIGYQAFADCKELIIFSVPQRTQLDRNVIAETALLKGTTFETDEDGDYENTQEVNAWIKNINDEEEYALHRACSSYNPLTDIIYDIVKRQGLKSFATKNQIGVTPLQYLKENPFANIDQQNLMKRYILEMMGATV